MIIKPRCVPIALSQLPRLLSRLPADHPSREKVSSHLQSIRAGFHGEQFVDEKLHKMNWDAPTFTILDLNVESGLTRCQIDTLVFTPSYVLLLEIKNYSGTLVFNGKSYQMTRITREGLEQGFDSPISQLRRATRVTEDLLARFQLPLPIHHALVLPYAKTIVKGTVDVPIVFAKSLSNFISELPSTPPLVSAQDLQLSAEKIAALHLPFYPTDFQKRYDFHTVDLRKGIICADCARIVGKKSIRLHHCSFCQKDFSNGYARALQDWHDFVSPHIRSAECRSFLGLSSKDATYHVLKKEAEQVARGLWRIKKPHLPLE